MEDGVKVLSQCFKEKSLTEFCKKNAVLAKEITQRPTEYDREYYEFLYKKYDLGNFKSDAKIKPQHKEFLTSYQARRYYARGVKEFGQSTHVVNKVYKLTSLPARFLVNIERYDTMRHFLQNEKNKFQKRYKPNETVLQHLIRKGTIRTSNEQKIQDLKGQDFLSRRARYQDKSGKRHFLMMLEDI